MFSNRSELSVRNAAGKLFEIFLRALRTEAAAEIKRTATLVSAGASLTADEEERLVTQKCMEVWLAPLVRGLVRSESKVQDGLLTYALSPLLQLHPTALSPLLYKLAAMPSTVPRRESEVNCFIMGI